MKEVEKLINDLPNDFLRDSEQAIEGAENMVKLIQDNTANNGNPVDFVQQANRLHFLRGFIHNLRGAIVADSMQEDHKEVRGFRLLKLHRDESVTTGFYVGYRPERLGTFTTEQEIKDRINKSISVSDISSLLIENVVLGNTYCGSCGKFTENLDTMWTGNCDTCENAVKEQAKKYNNPELPF